MRLKAVIFDFDGVLVDDERLHFALFRDLLQPFGMDLDFATYRSRYMAYTDREALEQIFRDHGREPDARLLAGLCREKQRRFRDRIRDLPPLPGVPQALRWAAQRYALALASGCTRAEIEAFLDRHGLRQYFRVLVTADDVRRGKPDPEPYLRALQRLRADLSGLRAAQCVAVEDTPGGIQSAHAAGMKVVALTTSLSRDQLRAADLVVDGDFRAFPWAAVEGLVAEPETEPRREPGSHS